MESISLDLWDDTYGEMNGRLHSINIWIFVRLTIIEFGILILVHFC